MTTYYHEHRLREIFRDLAERDRQLTRWGWFRRNEGHPQESGWRVRTGEALIRLGCRVRGRNAARPAHTSAES
jgi:hypothetical protein